MSEDPEFRVRVTPGTTNHGADEAAVIHVGGELDLLTAPELEAQLAKLLESDRPQLVADLAGLTFLDSTGISVLVRAARSAKEAGGTFTVRNPSSRIGSVFDITGLNEYLNVEHPG